MAAVERGVREADGGGVREMKNVLKGLVLVGLVGSTAAFTHATVFGVTDGERGLFNMHHELVIGDE